ncbi:MAG: hypothetical protein E6J85_19360 [Deltaproteobacteria bacterium]|nr:MAG: hypothetical protein E6J85_19360 [Deltaproteobacteria bacterium]
MAILQALISLITKSAGKILNAAFGWAVLALFGRTTPKEQTLLSAVVAAAAAWPLLVVGIAFPKAMLFVVSFVPLSKSVPSLALRIVWIALALFVPLIVGSMIAARAPKDALPESSLKRLLRGFQVTFALAVAFVLMLVLAPGMKIVNALKGRKDVRLPALVQEGAGGEFMSAFVAALALHHIELRPGDPPWSTLAHDRSRQPPQEAGWTGLRELRRRAARVPRRCRARSQPQSQRAPLAGEGTRAAPRPVSGPGSDGAALHPRDHGRARPGPGAPDQARLADLRRAPRRSSHLGRADRAARRDRERPFEERRSVRRVADRLSRVATARPGTARRRRSHRARRVQGKRGGADGFGEGSPD